MVQEMQAGRPVEKILDSTQRMQRAINPKSHERGRPTGDISKDAAQRDQIGDRKKERAEQYSSFPQIGLAICRFCPRRNYVESSDKTKNDTEPRGSGSKKYQIKRNKHIRCCRQKIWRQPGNQTARTVERGEKPGTNPDLLDMSAIGGGNAHTPRKKEKWQAGNGVSNLMFEREYKLPLAPAISDGTPPHRNKQESS